jgi:hypothetical protein
MSIDNYITIRYVAFWTMNKAISTVTELLFALKTEMELNSKVPFGMFGYHDKETNKLLPVSIPFWKEESHKNKREDK